MNNDNLPPENSQPSQGSANQAGAVYEARISRGIYVRPIIFAVVCMVFTTFDVERGTGPIFGIFALMVFFPIFLARCWTQRASHRYVVTESGLKMSIGLWALLKKKNSFLPRRQIESVSIEQGFLGRMFGYGHVVVTATGGRGAMMRWVNDPEKLASQLEG